MSTRTPAYEKSRHHTDFTKEDLIRILNEWVYDTSKADPQLGYNNGEGGIDDVYEDRKTTHDCTGVNAQHQHTLYLRYGQQEELWEEMMEKVAEMMDGQYERKIWLSLCPNPATKCSLTMNFSWNEENTEKRVKLDLRSFNEMFFPDTLGHTKQPQKRTTYVAVPSRKH